MKEVGWEWRGQVGVRDPGCDMFVVVARRTSGALVRADMGIENSCEGGLVKLLWL